MSLIRADTQVTDSPGETLSRADHLPAAYLWFDNFIWAVIPPDYHIPYCDIVTRKEGWY